MNRVIKAWNNLVSLHVEKEAETSVDKGAVHVQVHCLRRSYLGYVFTGHQQKLWRISVGVEFYQIGVGLF